MSEWVINGGYVHERSAPECSADRCRPVVVIDPEDGGAVERLWVAMLNVNRTNAQAALREFATPTPPKPDEPTGRYAAVVDNEGNEWLRAPSGMWCEQHTGERSGAIQIPEFRWLHYKDITAVRVLSPGVQP
jgi:hypothetical protein